MPTPHPFDVQKLLSEQLQVPPEYRIEELASLMKTANILQASEFLLPFPKPVLDKDSAKQFASEIQNIEELAFIGEVLRTDSVNVWADCIQRDADTLLEYDALGEMCAHSHTALSDIRHNILLANQASDDAQWLGYINEYLASYGIAPLDLKTDSAQERMFRIRSAASPDKYHGGPLVSVIMPVFNGAPHLEWAARSILDQSWTQLELIIVDDCSTDGTAEIVRGIAANDSRVKAICTQVNSGPYVAKNLGLSLAQGDLITGQDADDWAHPCRLENQVKHLVAYGQPVGIGHMIRMKPSGRITKLDLPSSFSSDGILKKAGISAIFNADFFHSRLGSWDNVRFAADSELLGRAAKAMGHPIAFANVLTMLCLDMESSLSNRPGSVIEMGGLSGDRLEYRLAWYAWHAKLDANSTYLPLNQGRRYFDAPLAMQNRLAPSDEVPAP